VGDRIQLDGGRLTAESCSLKRNGTASSEHIEHLRRNSIIGSEHFGSRLVDRQLWTTPATQRTEQSCLVFERVITACGWN
jgi:hypothetical protein